MSNGATDEYALWEAWGKRFEELADRHPLRVLFWQTTLACDSCCEYCSSPQEWWKPEAELSTEEICLTLENIARDFDLTGFAQLAFSGGEPLLRKDLPVVARHAKELGFPVLAIQTNGHLAAQHPDLVQELIEAGVTVWGVNIDGPRVLHDNLRKTGAWFDSALEFARQICRNERLATTITTLACRKNLGSIPQIYELVREIGPDLWRIAHFDPIGRGADVADTNLLSTHDLRGLLVFVASVRAQHQTETASFDVEIACGGWLGREWEGIVRPYIFHCVSGLDTMTILYDGGITGCPVVSRKLTQGNVREDCVKDVWESRFGFFRNARHRAPDRCLTCFDWLCCHGGCLHNYERLEPDWAFPTCLKDSEKKNDHRKV